MNRLAAPAVAFAIAFAGDAANPASAAHAPTKAGAVAQVAYVGNRIAVDVDGNFNDPDDWAATPATLAILARQELQPNLVHYSYNNSLGSNANDAFMYGTMSSATLKAAEQFGFDRDDFYDLQTSLPEAIANLREQANISTAGNPLYIIAAGPMEFLWRALKDSDPDARGHVTVISHSPWNNNRVWRPSMTHTDEDVKALGVNWVQISDQNRLFHTKTDWSPWRWLRNAAQPRMRHIYERMQAASKPDISDAGMAYFLVTNDQNGTPAKLKTFMGEWSLPPSPVLVTAQAEAGRLYRAMVEANHGGFSGDGFVNYRNQTGGYIEFDVPAPKPGNATLTFRFANGTNSARPLRILLNGQRVTNSMSFGPTGAWDAWRTKSLTVQVSAGTNRIRAVATAGTGGPNIDRIMLSMPGS
jgi:hypothetical protein